MKKLTSILSILLCAALLLIFSGCGKQEASASYPSDYNKYSVLIGMTKDEVCAQLGLAEEALTEQSTGLYATGQKATFQNMEFEILLAFDVTNEQKLYGIQYQAIFDGQIQQAMADSIALAKQFNAWYADSLDAAYKDQASVLAQWDAATQMTSLSQAGTLNAENTWDLTSHAGDAAQKLMDDSHYANYKMGFMLNLRFTANQEADGALIQLAYQVQAT